MKRTPQRGEIWYVKLPTDPVDKPPRPVVVVSVNERNRHPRASTILVAPLSGSIEKEVPTHIQLSSGETGLHPSCVKCEDLTTVFKEALIESRQQLRTVSHSRICQIANGVRIAMGCSSPAQDT